MSSDSVATLVDAWKEADEAEKAAKERKVELAAEIIGSGVEVKPFGVAVATRTGGYKAGLVDLLKEKGLRNAFEVTEKPVTKIVDTLIQTGVLEAAVVAPFKNADSVFIRRLKQDA